MERCIACADPLKDGDLYFPDVSGGFIHASCCGPERESYTNADGEPLGPDDPIPSPRVWGDSNQTAATHPTGQGAERTLPETGNSGMNQ